MSPQIGNQNGENQQMKERFDQFMQQTRKNGPIPTKQNLEKEEDEKNVDQQEKGCFKSKCYKCLSHDKTESRCGKASLIILLMITTLLLSSAINTIQLHFLLNKQASQTDSNDNYQLNSRVQAQAPLDPSLCPVNSLKELTEGWTYFEQPLMIQEFTYNTTEETVIQFSKIIPLTLKAAYIELIIHIRSDNEPWNAYWTRIRVINGDKQYIRNLYNINYQVWGLQSNSETFILPVEFTRQIRIRAGTTNKRGRLWARLFINSYKLKA